MGLEENREEWEEKRNPYTKQLLANLQERYPDADIQLNAGTIFLNKAGDPEKDIKQWLYNILESLPEIPHQIERVQFVIYENGEMRVPIIINPAEEDAYAIQNAIDRKLHFSGGSSYLKALPLNNEYYNKKI